MLSSSFSIMSARILAFAVVLGGCTSRAPVPARAPAPAPARGPVELAPIVVSPYSDAELAAEFERARALLLADEVREAAPLFDRLVRLAPDGEVAPPSLFNAGLAYEALGDRPLAAERYGEVARRFPDHALARGALFRLARVTAALERWPELVAVARRLLRLGDLRVLEAIEARGALALGLVEQGLVDEAARQVTLARDLIEAHRLGEAGKPPLELAQVSFALGEVRRRRSEAITFVPAPASFAEALERRCQGLLDAQSAYTEAMRSLDAHWSAMAGYRIGQLYKELHRDVMQVPPPPSADTPRKRQLFEGAMRLRYRVLLEKGQKMLAGTVRLGERTGEAPAWALRARDALREIDLALAEEQAALARLPFTEAELSAALDALKTAPAKGP
ncbi:tetratricopeptide repeat protein [Sorangium sp. So ce1036]|uniref:tetratricopeptide repeat protein n=1 Tax=Sorangium sp. So ce1036 TaxID=3133328 RepID=UPI003F0A8062